MNEYKVKKRIDQLEYKLKFFEKDRVVIGGDSYYRINYNKILDKDFGLMLRYHDHLIFGNRFHLKVIDFKLYEYEDNLYTSISNLDKLDSKYDTIMVTLDISPLKVRMRENRLRRLLK